jgi:hypothetical protein
MDLSARDGEQMPTINAHNFHATLGLMIAMGTKFGHVLTLFQGGQDQLWRAALQCCPFATFGQRLQILQNHLAASGFQ